MADETTFTTYRRADGELIAGEYAFVTELEWWTEHDLLDPEQVVKEVWTLVESEVITLKPNGHDELQAELDEERAQEGRPKLLRCTHGIALDEHCYACPTKFTRDMAKPTRAPDVVRPLGDE